MVGRTETALIEAIYASTVLSRSIHSIANDLEGHVVEQVKQACPPGAASSLLDPPGLNMQQRLEGPDIQRHVELALHIQREMGFEPGGHDVLQALLDRMTHPALAFDSNGEILRANGAAGRAGWREGSTLVQVTGGGEAGGAILGAAQAIPQADAMTTAPVRLGASATARCGVVIRAEAPIAARWARDVWILMTPDHAIGSSIAVQSKALFGLTEAEAAVAARFAEGVSLEGIAHERAVSMETIRTQIKAIKMKTGARDLPGLMRLLCGLASGAFAPAGETAGQSAQAGRSGEPQSGSMRLTDGRRFDYLRQGAVSGLPVLLLHNLPYGAQLTRAAARYAMELDLSIVAPLRAGFCHSDPSAARDTEALLDQSSDDMRHLMDHLGIARASLIGHAAGATQAIRFATRYPERVSSILIVTRGPVWNKAWLRDVAPHHRAQSIIMRHMPGAGRLLMGATLKHFNKYGARDYSVRATKGSPSDLAAHDDPEFLDLIGRGVTFGLRQGPEIFCREWALMELDLTGEARSLPHPIRLIYGAEDPLLLPVFAERFAAAVPKTELIRLEGAGHFLFYTHPRDMLDAVMRDCASPAVAAAHHQ